MSQQNRLHTSPGTWCRNGCIAIAPVVLVGCMTDSHGTQWLAGHGMSKPLTSHSFRNACTGAVQCKQFASHRWSLEPALKLYEMADKVFHDVYGRSVQGRCRRSLTVTGKFMRDEPLDGKLLPCAEQGSLAMHNPGTDLYQATLAQAR
jgi:hypothetical protein